MWQVSRMATLAPAMGVLEPIPEALPTSASGTPVGLANSTRPRDKL